MPFSRFWLHNRFMNVEGRKMAKSEGNFWTLDDLVEKGCDPVAVRYHLLSTHYRSPMNFSLEGIEAAGTAVERIRTCVRNLVEDCDVPPLAAADEARLAKFEERFRDALADDLNVSEALGQVHDAVRWVNAQNGWDAAGAGRVRALFGVFDRLLDVLRADAAPATRGAGATDAAIDALVAEREAARRARDFAKSDALRERLTDLGVVLEDTPRGPRWTRK